MLLDLRSLVEVEGDTPPAASTTYGGPGRRLRPPYRDAPGFHVGNRVGWKPLTGTRTVTVQALGGSQLGVQVVVTVRQRPVPVPEAVILPVRQRVLARVKVVSGSHTQAVKRVGRHQQEDEDLLLTRLT